MIGRLANEPEYTDEQEDRMRHLTPAREIPEFIRYTLCDLLDPQPEPRSPDSTKLKLWS